MKKLLFSTIILIIILSCNKTASATADEEIVATWRGGQITLKEYEEFAIYYAFQDSATAANSTFDERRKILNDMIKFKLVETLADSLQLDTMKVMRDAYKSRTAAVAFRHHLFEDSVRSKIINEVDIENAYNKMKYTYYISHILIKIDKNDRNIIDSIYTYLKNNPESFSSVARNESDDQASAESGGDLGWNLCVNFVPEFEEQILTLKQGEISKPFLTEYGWHIAVVRDKMINSEISSYKTERPQIINRLIKKNLSNYDRVNSEFNDFLYSRYGVYVNNEAVEKSSRHIKKLMNSNRDPSASITDSDKNILLASFGGHQIFLNDFLATIQNTDKAFLKEFSEKDMRDFIFRTYYKKLAHSATSDLGYSKLPEVIKLVKEGMIIDYINHLTNSYRWHPKALEKWYSNLFDTYGVEVNHIMLESGFMNSIDNRK